MHKQSSTSMHSAVLFSFLLLPLYSICIPPSHYWDVRLVHWMSMHSGDWELAGCCLQFSTCKDCQASKLDETLHVEIAAPVTPISLLSCRNISLCRGTVGLEFFGLTVFYLSKGDWGARLTGEGAAPFLPLPGAEETWLGPQKKLIWVLWRLRTTLLEPDPANTPKRPTTCSHALFFILSRALPPHWSPYVRWPTSPWPLLW